MNTSLAFFEKEIQKYNPINASTDICVKFLPEFSHFIAGYIFADSEKNFELLTEEDLNAFSAKSASFMRKTKKSIFNHILVILYCDNNRYHWKIVHGMASKLIPICENWANSMNSTN